MLYLQVCFTQIEFLKDQIKEKDLVIRTLLISEQDYYYNYDYGESGSGCVEEDNDGHTRENSSISEESDNDGESNSVEEQSIASEGSSCKSVEDNIENDGGDENIDDEFFQELYKQYERNKKKELDNQLIEVRLQKHNLFQGTQGDKWPHGTTLIVGDSMINQMDEDRLSNNSKRSVKVRAFGGFRINEIYSKLDSLLKKKPSRIIIHLRTNDGVTRTSQSILDDLLKLKQYIEAKGI